MSSSNQAFDLVALTAQIIQISSPTGFIEPLLLPGLPGGSVPVVVIPGSGAQQIPYDTSVELGEITPIGYGQTTPAPGLNVAYAMCLTQANNEVNRIRQTPPTAGVS